MGLILAGKLADFSIIEDISKSFVANKIRFLVLPTTTKKNLAKFET